AREPVLCHRAPGSDGRTIPRAAGKVAAAVLNRSPNGPHYPHTCDRARSAVQRVPLPPRRGRGPVLPPWVHGAGLEHHTLSASPGQKWGEMEGFTSHQASRLTGCTPRQLRYWDQVGLVRPSVQATGGRPGVPRFYSFRDLVALRVVRSLLDGGMSLQRIRRAWNFLNRKAGLDQHLSEVKLVTDGVSIFKVVRKRGELLDALKEGQMAFFVAIDEIARSIDDEVAQVRQDRHGCIQALEGARRE